MNITKITLQIIELLLKDGKECYLREIAKKIKKSTSSVSRNLNFLKKEGIIKERRFGRELMYSLNLKNNITLRLCELSETQKLDKFYRKNKEMNIVLEDFLEKIKKHDVINITVFGSVAKGRYSKKSDIDLLIVTNEKRSFSTEIRDIYSEYGKNVSVINLTKRELKEKKSEQLIKEIVGNHLILLGYEYFISEVLTE